MKNNEKQLTKKTLKILSKKNYMIKKPKLIRIENN